MESNPKYISKLLKKAFKTLEHDVLGPAAEEWDAELHASSAAEKEEEFDKACAYLKAALRTKMAYIKSVDSYIDNELIQGLQSSVTSKEGWDEVNQILAAYKKELRVQMVRDTIGIKMSLANNIAKNGNVPAALRLLNDQQAIAEKDDGMNNDLWMALQRYRFLITVNSQASSVEIMAAYEVASKFAQENPAPVMTTLMAQMNLMYITHYLNREQPAQARDLMEHTKKMLEQENALQGAGNTSDIYQAEKNQTEYLFKFVTSLMEGASGVLKSVHKKESPQYVKDMQEVAAAVAYNRIDDSRVIRNQGIDLANQGETKACLQPLQEAHEVLLGFADEINKRLAFKLSFESELDMSEAKKQLLKILDDTHRDLATEIINSHTMLAEMLIVNDRHTESINQYNKAIDYANKYNQKSVVDLLRDKALALNNIPDSNSDKKITAELKGVVQQALDILKPHDHPELKKIEGMFCTIMASRYSAIEKNRKAIGWLEQADAMYSKYPPDHFEINDNYFKVKSTIIELYIDMGKHKKAEANCKALQQIIHRIQPKKDIAVAQEANQSFLDRINIKQDHHRHNE